MALVETFRIKLFLFPTHHILFPTSQTHTLLPNNWWVQSICCKLLGSKVMASARQTPSFTAFVPFYCQLGSHMHNGLDRLSTSLARRSRDVRRYEWWRVYRQRRRKREESGSGNDSERIEAQRWDLSYISLILSLSGPSYQPQRNTFTLSTFHYYLDFGLDIFIFICAATGVWAGSREVHHINCIDINSSAGTLPVPLMGA